MGDVEVGVQAQLPEPVPDSPDPLGQLLAQRLHDPLQPLLGLLGRPGGDRALVVLGGDGGEVADQVDRLGAGVLGRKRPASSCRAPQALVRAGGVHGVISLRRSRPRRSISAARNSAGCEAVQLGLDDPVQRGEALDPFTRLGGDLGRFDRRAHPHHEVELAPAGNLDHAGEVDLAKLHRRAGERAGDRTGVLGVHEQSQPGDHVAHLRAP